MLSITVTMKDGSKETYGSVRRVGVTQTNCLVLDRDETLGALPDGITDGVFINASDWHGVWIEPMAVQSAASGA